MTRIALRELRFHPVRFVMSVLAVVLGVAFVAGTFSLRVMMQDTFNQIIETSTNADAYVQGSEQVADAGLSLDGSSSANPVALDLVDRIKAADGVAHVVPTISGPIVLVGKDGTAVSSGFAPSLGMAISQDDPGVRLAAGRFASADDEITLDAATLTASGLAVGERTKVVLGTEPTDVTVVGSLSFDANFAGAVIVGLSQKAATTAYAPQGTVPTIAIYAAPGVSQETLTRNVAATLRPADKAEAVTGDKIRQDAEDQITEQLGFVGTFLLVFAAVALFVGAFIIANTFTMLIKRRQRELAMLRAIGASPAQVFGSTLTQSLAIGVVGSLLGVGAGIGLVAALRALLDAMGMPMSGTLPIDASTVLISLAVGTAMAALAAILPARRAALIKPIQAMAEASGAPEKPLTFRAIAGSVLLAAGIALAVVAVRHGDGATGMLGAAAVATLLGLLVVSPAISSAAMAVLAAPFVWLIKPLGKMARGNATRSPRRTSATASALMIGMALVGAVAVLAASMQASIKTVVQQELSADFLVSGVNGAAVSPGAVTAIDDVAGTRDYTLTMAQVEIDGAHGRMSGAPAGTFPHALAPTLVAGSWQAFDDGRAAVSKNGADDNGWHVGDTITIKSATATKQVTIGLIIDSQILGRLTVPTSVFNALVPAEQRQVRYVAVALDGASAAAVRADLTAAIKPFYVLTVQDPDELVTAIAGQVDQMMVILYALLGLSIVIAVLGIVNTLALGIMDRTREIGLVRAVGLGRLQLAGTVAIEAVLIALFGTIAGLAVGVGLASALPAVLGGQGLSELVIPWPQLAEMLGVAIVVGLAASLWPAIRAARMPILQAISYE